MTREEIKGEMLNRLSHQGTPFRSTFNSDPLPTKNFCPGRHTEDADDGAVLNGTGEKDGPSQLSHSSGSQFPHRNNRCLDAVKSCKLKSKMSPGNGQ